MSYRPTKDYDNKQEEKTIVINNWANTFFRGMILLLFFIVIGISVFFYSPYSKIQEITIYGTDLVDNSLILQATRVEIGDSFLKVNTNGIKEVIEKLKAIKSAEVTFFFPNSIEITIEEKKIVAYVYNDNNSLIPLLEDGTILLNYETIVPYKTRPVISNTLQDSIRFNLAHSLKNVPREILLGLSEIHIQDDETTVIFTRDGYELRMFFREIEDKLLIYRDIMGQLEFYGEEKGVIHMFDAIWYISYDNIIHEE